MSEEQVKEAIERIGYQEFYRYYQEKDILIEQQKQEIERLNNIIKEINNAFNDNNIHNNMELVKKIKNILKGIDLTDKDKRQIRGLKRDFKVGDKE